jgi:hypothetical protein
MASIISAGTTSGTALNMAGDTSGVLQLATNGSTTAITIDASQNVGIGTASPASALDVQATSGVSMFRLTATTGTNAVYSRYSNTGGFLYLGRDNSAGTDFGAAYSAGIWSTGAYPMLFGTNGSERMRMTSAGSLCIGTTTPNSQFLSSAARLTIGQWGVGPTVDFGNWYLQNSSGVGVQLISGNTSFSTLSDERTKTDLKPIENAIDKVATLRAVTGRYIKDEDVVSRAFLIAQDVQKVLPEAVAAGEDEDQTLQLKYTEVIPLLVAAIKEQQTIINDLKARITALEGAA